MSKAIHGFVCLVHKIPYGYFKIILGHNQIKVRFPTKEFTFKLYTYIILCYVMLYYIILYKRKRETGETEANVVEY